MKIVLAIQNRLWHTWVMVRLYNHTKYADEVIRNVFTWAARMAGVEGDVPVKVTHCTHLRGGGMAHNSFPYLKTLKGKPTTSQDRRTLKCPAGWIEMRLPRDTQKLDAKAGDPCLTAAEWFVDVAVHEMAHIRQYRQTSFGVCDPSFWGKRKGLRKIAHDVRPCEIDANNAMNSVRETRIKDRRRQDLAIALAIELERMNAA